MLLAALFGCLLVVLAAALEGKTGLEKTATKLSMPTGLAWLLLAGFAVQQLLARHWKASIIAGMCWLLLWLAATPPLANASLRFLENSEPHFRAQGDASLDVLVVLGGGTLQGPSRAQAGVSGDRVLYAAQLFQQGKALRLIATGDAQPALAATQTSPREQAIEIWTALGIPREAMSSLRGANTFQEIRSLKELMPELGGQRVGLLTSAYHLPRAMRLARRKGCTT